MGKKISYCGFNMVESLLRHTPEQLEVFLNRMNTLRLNTLMVQYDYGFKHYRELLLQYCSRYGIELRLMVFGPRSFFRLADWNPDMLSRQKDGKLFTDTLECETWPCRYAPGALEQFEYGAERFFCTTSCGNKIHSNAFRRRLQLLLLSAVPATYHPG